MNPSPIYYTSTIITWKMFDSNGLRVIITRVPQVIVNLEVDYKYTFYTSAGTSVDVVEFLFERQKFFIFNHIIYAIGYFWIKPLPLAVADFLSRTPWGGHLEYAYGHAYHRLGNAALGCLRDPQKRRRDVTFIRSSFMWNSRPFCIRQYIISISITLVKINKYSDWEWFGKIFVFFLTENVIRFFSLFFHVLYHHSKCFQRWPCFFCVSPSPPRPAPFDRSRGTKY